MTKKTKTTAFLWSAAALAAAFAACDNPNPEPTKAPTKPIPSATSKSASQDKAGASQAAKANPHASKPATNQGLKWTKPAEWKEVQHASRMRKATYAIPKADGDPADGEMSVTQVGGSTQANIDRWKGQFDMDGDAVVSEKDVGGLKVTIAEIRGTFKGGGMGMGGPSEPQKNWMMLTAIAHTKPQPHFFKLTGPVKTVEAARESFNQLVTSMKE